MTAERKYSIDIQTFSEIIRGGYLYVDKSTWCGNWLTMRSISSWVARADLASRCCHRRCIVILQPEGQQIDERGYSKPFATDGRKIVKVGIKFSPETMTGRYPNKSKRVQQLP